MIQPGTDIAAWAAEHRVKFIRKDHSWLHRLIGWFMLTFFKYDYMRRAWTTIGRTIAYPVTGPPSVAGWDATDLISPEGAELLQPYLEEHRRTIEHEFHHVQQYEALWHLHSLLYLMFPLPVFFAWYRVRCELLPYAHECAFYGRDQDEVVQTLFAVYGWPYPKAWMRTWLAKEVTFLKVWHKPKAGR